MGPGLPPASQISNNELENAGAVALLLHQLPICCYGVACVLWMVSAQASFSGTCRPAERSNLQGQQAEQSEQSSSYIVTEQRWPKKMAEATLPPPHPRSCEKGQSRTYLSSQEMQERTSLEIPGQNIHSHLSHPTFASQALGKHMAGRREARLGCGNCLLHPLQNPQGCSKP